MATETGTLAHTLLTARVIEVLRGIRDPELPVNIYDLGLVYGIEVKPETGTVHVRMTLTAPGCPVAQTFPGKVECAIRALADIREARVELVWDPPWDRSRMNEMARLALAS